MSSMKETPRSGAPAVLQSVVTLRSLTDLIALRGDSAAKSDRSWQSALAQANVELRHRLVDHLKSQTANGGGGGSNVARSNAGASSFSDGFSEGLSGIRDRIMALLEASTIQDDVPPSDALRLPSGDHHRMTALTRRQTRRNSEVMKAENAVAAATTANATSGLAVPGNLGLAVPLSPNASSQGRRTVRKSVVINTTGDGSSQPPAVPASPSAAALNTTTAIAEECDRCEGVLAAWAAQISRLFHHITTAVPADAVGVSEVSTVRSLSFLRYWQFVRTVRVKGPECTQASIDGLFEKLDTALNGNVPVSLPVPSSSLALPVVNAEAASVTSLPRAPSVRDGGKASTGVGLQLPRMISSTTKPGFALKDGSQRLQLTVADFCWLLVELANMKFGLIKSLAQRITRLLSDHVFAAEAYGTELSSSLAPAGASADFRQALTTTAVEDVFEQHGKWLHWVFNAYSITVTAAATTHTVSSPAHRAPLTVTTAGSAGAPDGVPSMNRSNSVRAKHSERVMTFKEFDRFVTDSRAIHRNAITRKVVAEVFAHVHSDTAAPFSSSSDGRRDAQRYTVARERVGSTVSTVEHDASVLNVDGVTVNAEWRIGYFEFLECIAGLACYAVKNPVSAILFHSGYQSWYWLMVQVV